MPFPNLLETLLIAIFLFLLVHYLQNLFQLTLPFVSIVIYLGALMVVFNDFRMLIFGAIVLTISEIDRRDLRIPDPITKPLLMCLSLVMSNSLEVLALAWVWLGAMYALTYFFPTLIGRGDLKLIAVLILLHGLCTAGSSVAFLAWLCTLASVFALPEAIIVRKRTGNRHFPFGPAISAASLVLFALAPQ